MKRLVTDGKLDVRVWILVGLFGWMTGCAPDIPEDEDVERTHVVFDTEQQLIPLPNNAALEDDGTLPMQEAEPDTAQEDFNAYLDTLHGFLPSTPITIPVSGPIDEETLEADDLLVFAFSEEGEASQLEVADVGFNEETLQIEAQLAEPPPFDQNLGYVLREGVEGEEGEPVVPAQIIALTTFEDPLIDEDGEPTTELLEGREDEAEQLEPLRESMQPLYEAAEESGVERNQVIAAASWSTANDAFAVFDPDTGQVPIPNNFLLGDDGTVDLPVPEGADELTTGVIEELNEREGFSTTANGWVPIDGSPLDPETVDHESVLLATSGGGPPDLYPEERLGIEYREEFDIIDYYPEMVPFESDLLNAGVVTTDVTDDEGRPIKPSPVFVFLRTEHPVFEDGESTVDILGDEEAEQLEAARQEYELLFTT
ncbi:MAG: hypothetical protein ACOC9W_01405, partial [Persicimonas sp.]